MGQQSRLKEQRRGEVIHRRRFFNGRMTAQEVHARWGIRQPCFSCGKMPVIMIRSLMLHDEFVKADPLLAAEIARTNPTGPFIPTFPTTYGPMVVVSRVTACSIHQREAEKAAAKAPSGFLIEIDRGPGADNPVVAIPLNGTGRFDLSKVS